MKMILLTSIILVAAFASKAQVVKSGCNDQIIIIGIADRVSEAVADGLLSAHLQRTSNQVVLVAGKPLTSTYYAIADQRGQLLRTGKFTKLNAGEYQVLDLGTKPEEYQITFSTTPLLAGK